MRLSFHGAAGEVTGSCYLVETATSRVLVDFGLHQGGPAAERLNRRLPPVDFARLDAVVLTHAHLDHCGRLPLLHRTADASHPGGDQGPRIWATPATIGLCDILLRDAASLMEADAARQSVRRARLGRAPAGPLYSLDDVDRLMPRFSPIPYDRPREIAEGISIRLVDAGHILGSASVEMTVREGSRTRVIAFSADIGERGSPLLHDPTPIPRCDVMVLESTYGDRDHRGREPTIDEFVSILAAARHEGGVVLIPAFAVGRTQHLVYVLGELIQQQRVRGLDVYVDSPMALSATELYERHRALWDDESRRILEAGRGPLSFPGLHYVRSADQSRALNALRGSAIVIAGSGMCTGGRILHHLKHRLWRPETRLVFVGFQADGTLGRRIVAGARTVRVMDATIAVKAHVHTLGGFSAHAGQSGLVEWAAAAKASSPRVFLTHGEDRPRMALRERLLRVTGMDAALPVRGEAVDL
jgi:metallo-beta-lactamase family protein